MRNYILLFLFSICCGLQHPLENQGNKRHVFANIYKTYHNHGNCSNYIIQWKTWEGGFEGKILVHSRAEPAIPYWKAELILTKDATSLRSYDAFSSSDSGAQFQFLSVAWNSFTRYGEERFFTVHGTSPPGQEAPRIKSLSINGGEILNCVSQFNKYQGLSKDSNENTNDDSKKSSVSLPSKIMGIYVLLADDTEKGHESDSDSWTPELYKWQQEASNVLFFTFIHPDTMKVPPAFQKLAASRGTGMPGSVPNDTIILFAIGGYSYSIKPNPWHWLTSKEGAEKMAEKVSEWPEKYGCDGIDLDLEEGAGSRKEAGPNMIHFVRKLRQLRPNMIISQPTYGYPQVTAEIDVINASWDVDGNWKGVADAVGLMVYEGTQALNYVKNYANGTSQWEGFPIKVNVPTSSILLGAKGSTSYDNIKKLADSCVKDDLLGIMVWYSSVKNGFQYAPYWDATGKQDSIKGYKYAKQLFDNYNK